MSKKDKEKKKGKSKQQTNEIVEIKGIGNTGEPFKKGLAIIVGNEPDGISVHVAMLLGCERVFLNNLENHLL